MSRRRFREGRKDKRRIEDACRLKGEYVVLSEAELRSVVLGLRAEVRNLEGRPDYAGPIATLLACHGLDQ